MYLHFALSRHRLSNNKNMRWPSWPDVKFRNTLKFPDPTCVVVLHGGCWLPSARATSCVVHIITGREGDYALTRPFTASLHAPLVLKGGVSRFPSPVSVVRRETRGKKRRLYFESVRFQTVPPTKKRSAELPYTGTAPLSIPSSLSIVLSS